MKIITGFDRNHLSYYSPSQYCNTCANTMTTKCSDCHSNHILGFEMKFLSNLNSIRNEMKAYLPCGQYNSTDLTPVPPFR